MVSSHAQLDEWIRKQFGLAVSGHVLLPPDRLAGPFVAREVAGPSPPLTLDQAFRWLRKPTTSRARLLWSTMSPPMGSLPKLLLSFRIFACFRKLPISVSPPRRILVPTLHGGNICFS